MGTLGRGKQNLYMRYINSIEDTNILHVHTYYLLTLDVATVSASVEKYGEPDEATERKGSLS